MMRWTAPTTGIAMCQNTIAIYELLEGKPPTHGYKQTLLPSSKWKVDFDDCIFCFVEQMGCGICIAERP